MNITESRVLDFLKANRVGVLSVLLKDGSPHGATVHFSSTENPTRLFFLTDRNYRKCEALLEGEAVGASFVIGFSEEEMRTLQMDGTVRIVSDPREIALLKKIHFAKISTAQEYENNPDSVYLEFTPSWWQYTDYHSDPETRITSNEL